MRRLTRREELARYAAPAAFLVAMTILVLLVRDGLTSGSSGTKPVTTAATTVRTSETTTAVTRTKPKPPAKRYYAVQRGDTFSIIAARFGTTVETLQALNPGVSSSSLTIGQRLRIR